MLQQANPEFLAAVLKLDAVGLQASTWDKTSDGGSCGATCATPPKRGFVTFRSDPSRHLHPTWISILQRSRRSPGSHRVLRLVEAGSVELETVGQEENWCEI